MPSEIQQNRYDQLIRRVAGIVGPGSKVAEALTELFPTIDVENVPGELLLLSGTKLAFGGGVIAGAAGQTPKFQLQNPEDSGFLITVTGVYFASQNPTIVRWGVQQVALPVGSVGTQQFRDTRLLAPSAPVGRILQQSAVALANGQNQSVLDAREPFKLEDPNGVMVLAPGVSFEMGGVTTQDTVHYSIYWRERPFEQSEINF